MTFSSFKDINSLESYIEENNIWFLQSDIPSFTVHGHNGHSEGLILNKFKPLFKLNE